MARVSHVKLDGLYMVVSCPMLVLCWVSRTCQLYLVYPASQTQVCMLFQVTVYQCCEGYQQCGQAHPAYRPGSGFT